MVKELKMTDINVSNFTNYTRLLETLQHFMINIENLLDFQSTRLLGTIDRVVVYIQFR